MLRLLAILLLALSGFSATPALAWNSTGHRLVALIAWQEMAGDTRDRLSSILARHPDYPRWVAGNPAQPARAAFVEAAVWPDTIRSDPRFYEPGLDAPTPPFAGMRDTQRHRRWHYLDLPLQGSGPNVGDGELDQAFPRMLAWLKRDKDPVAQAYALPWVIHLIGDIHQPLHVASQGDEGGNQFLLEDPFNPRLPNTNLHRWWDDRPGPFWLDTAALEKRVVALLAEQRTPVKLGDLRTWLAESQAIARTSAYPDASSEAPAVVSEAFRMEAGRVTRQQLVAAGRRLAHLLDQIFSVSRETP